MGPGQSRPFRGLLARNHRRLALLGLDSAGKTTILNTITQVLTKSEKQACAAETVPTVEFEIKIAKYKRWKLFITDVGGQDTLRPHWRHHFTGLQGVIFVVDCSDKARISLALKEFNSVLADDQLKGIPIFVFGNKQDLPGAMTKEELSEKLKISERQMKAPEHLIMVVTGSGKTGEGIFEGLDWLCQHSNHS